MIRSLALFGLLLGVASVHAGEYYLYPAIPADYAVREGTTVEVPNLPPVKDQDGVGLCYAFASTVLLEHLNCTVKALSCAERGEDRRLSALDVASYKSTSRGVAKGGDPVSVLRALSKKGSKIVRESCAPYESLIATEKLPDNQFITSQGVGYRKLREIYEMNRLTDCADCVDRIRETLGEKLKVNLIEIRDALQAKTFEEFAYQVLIPQKCHDQAVELPEFIHEYYPGEKKEVSEKDFQEVLLRNLKDQIPTEASFCSEEDESGECVGGHSVVVVGARQMCGARGCKVSFRLQNSYGKTWEEINHGGWIDGEWFLKQMKTFMTVYSDDSLMNWVRPVGKNRVRAN